MAKVSWSSVRVEDLIDAIKGKDVAEINRLVAMHGNGSLPEKEYVRYGEKFGPDEILAACIRTEDIDLFDHLVELGMNTKGFSPDSGVSSKYEVLFGGIGPNEKNGDRNPAMLRKLVEAGFDFSSLGECWDIYAVQHFIEKNSDDVALFESLRDAGMRYCSGYGASRPEDDHVRYDWNCREMIPWEYLLCNGCYGLLEHFINSGYRPVGPLRLQVGANLPEKYKSSEDTTVPSTEALDFLLEKQLPTFGIIAPSAVEQEDLALLKYCVNHGIGFHNPEAVFGLLDYELAELALEKRICDVKPEYIGPARAAKRKDILELFERFGISEDDMTSELVDELTAIIEGAEFCSTGVKEEARKLSHDPKAPLEAVNALKNGATADWKNVTRLLARLYFASYDNGDWKGLRSVRNRVLKVFAGDIEWPEIFELCLNQFGGNLDIKLILPMAKISEKGYPGHEKAFGITYWFESDARVCELLAARGAKFLCKINSRYNWNGWDRKNPDKLRDAERGDVFIWLSPEVSKFVFAQNGWSEARMAVSHEGGHGLGYDMLGHLLLGSGNANAYQWFMENAADVKEFKKPVLKDVVGTPLLRPYLEDKKDASVRSKEIVDFIRQTIKGDCPDDTALLVTKAALDDDAIKKLRGTFKRIVDKGISPEEDALARAAQAAIEALDSRPTKSAPAKKTAEKKPTVAQLVALAADALDEGDSSKLSEFESIASKVPMADCVELLERAAAKCDGETIDRLYELFEPFEYVSSALLVALFSGNVSAAKALLSHGADLEGKMTMVDEKRTPSSKKSAREKRYAHGLMVETYSSGGVKAHSLRESLTKYRGKVASRSRKAQYSWQGDSRGFAFVNDVSSEKAAATLVAISKEKGFKASIAKRLLWNLVSFDGRKTSDACFEAEAVDIILEAGILGEEYLADLPWDEAVSSMESGYCVDGALAFSIIKANASPERFAKCWRPRFAKQNKWSGSYDDIEALLAFVDVLDADNCSNQTEVLKALVETGNVESLKVLAGKPGWFNERRAKNLIDAASAVGQTEVTAWLLEMGSQGSGDSASNLSL